jgi:hypothetical protein
VVLEDVATVREFEVTDGGSNVVANRCQLVAVSDGGGYAVVPRVERGLQGVGGRWRLVGQQYVDWLKARLQGAEWVGAERRIQ